MAYSDYPGYSDAFQKVQTLSFQLHGLKGSLATGLAGDLASFRTKYGADSEKYIKLKAKYDSLDKQLTTAEDVLTKIKAQADAEPKDTGVDKAKAKAKIDAAYYEQVAIQAKATNDTAGYNAAMEKAVAAENLNIGGAPDINPQVTPATTVTDPYMSYTVSTDPNNQQHLMVPNVADEVFLIPPGKDGKVNAPNGTPYFTNIDDARNAYVKSMNNDTNAIMKQLVTIGAMTAKQAKSGIYMPALNNFLLHYSVDTVVRYQQTNGTGKLQTINDFIKNTISGGGIAGLGGTKTSTTDVTTLRPMANKDINRFFMDNFGRPATPQEQVEYYNMVAKAEAVAKTSTTTTTDASGNIKASNVTDTQLTAADYTLMQATVAGKALKGTKVGDLLASKTSGVIVNDINKLMSIASDYAVPMTQQQALDYVAAGIGQSNYLTKQTDRIKQLAITLHPTLAPHIQAGGTVKDVTDVYANAMAKKIGVVVKDSTQDKRIMDAASNGVNLSAWDKIMQGMPEWAKTPEAHNTAADFANTILTSFGFGGN